MNIMKAKLCIFVFVVVCFSSCWHLPADYSKGEIAFFQFTDTNLIHKAILRFDSLPMKTDFKHSWGDVCWIPLYPKNIKGQPIFGKKGYQGASNLHNWIIGTTYSLEELINTPKYIALKDNYYICYPFMDLASYGCYVNVDWKDLLTLDTTTLEVYTNMPYAKRYVIFEDDLVRLTKKSTMHFRGLKKDMITIDDVVEVLNELIETNTIEEYCFANQRHCY